MTLEECSKDILSASQEIPFENSFFQNENFIVKAQLTPARAYRSILLRLTNKIAALREAEYTAEKENIEIQELMDKINREKDNPDRKFDIMRWSLDLRYKEQNRGFSLKLVNDAIKDVEHLYRLFKSFHRYTREEFEAEEKEHFILDLKRKLNGLDGASDALSSIDETLIYNKELEAPKTISDIISKADKDSYHISQE